MKKYVNNSFISKSPLEYKNGTEVVTSLPVTLYTDGQPVSSWIMEGNTVNGVGEETANLFSGKYSQFDSQGGTGTAYNYFKLDSDFTLTVKAKNAVTAPNDYYFGITANGGNASGGYTWVIASNASWTEGETRTVKSSMSDYHCLSFYPKTENVFNWIIDNFEIMLNLGNTAEPYEPYGYKISILSNQTALSPIFLSQPLRKSLDDTTVDTLDSTGLVTYNVDEDGQPQTPTTETVTVPTITTTGGEVTLDTDTTVKPSEFSLTYHGWHENEPTKY